MQATSSALSLIPKHTKEDFYQRVYQIEARTMVKFFESLQCLVGGWGIICIGLIKPESKPGEELVGDNICIGSGGLLLKFGNDRRDVDNKLIYPMLAEQTNTYPWNLIWMLVERAWLFSRGEQSLDFVFKAGNATFIRNIVPTRTQR